MNHHILDLPIGENDINAPTIRSYLKELLTTLWQQQEGFSGKRPFGNGNWTSPLNIALVKAGKVNGKLDPDGYIEQLDTAMAKAIIHQAIRDL